MSLPIFTKTSFTAGEVDVDLAGRGDLALYANGARALRNVVVAPIGGVRRRPGLRHVANGRGAGRLIAFEFNTEQTYLLALSDGWLDIYADGDKVGELATPWSAAQIAQVNWTQSADTLLVVHPDVAPRKITRTGAGTWTIAEWSYYEEEGVLYLPTHKFAEDAVTLTLAAGGALVLTTDAAVDTVTIAIDQSGLESLIGLSSAGRALIDDADAAAQRATLGLGSAATLNTAALHAMAAALAR